MCLSCLLILLLSSCGSFRNGGLEKRHYRPGYFISTNSSNSLKAVPAGNTVPGKEREVVSVKDAVLNEKQKKAQPETKKQFSAFVNSRLNMVKARVSNTGEKLVGAVKDVGTSSDHIEKATLKPEKINSGKETKVRAEGKTYSLSTVAFVVGAILIIWGLAVLFASIPMMSTDIALALTILIGLALVIIWGLIVLMIKSWFNGDNEPAKI